jgi:cyclopropane fatty-acyl-phospholipid synthase-like methyltransferase
MNIKQINSNNKPEGLDEESKEILKGFVYGDALFPNSISKYHNSYELLAKELIKIFNPKIILELGSGGGDLSFFIRKHGPNITDYVSVDINKKAASLSNYEGNNSHHFIAYTDRPLHFVDENNQTVIFDLILSFEHFEHITTNTFEILLDNLKYHMDKNSIVLATASIITRDNCHVNIKQKNEWISYLKSNGFSMVENLKILTTDNEPFHIRIENQTNELIFKL